MSNRSVQEFLGEDLVAQVAAIRAGMATGLRSLLVARIRSLDPGTRISVHGSSDPWATGSFSTVHPSVGDSIDGVVASCWDHAAGSERMDYLNAGMNGLHLYHLGLLGRAGLETFRGVVEATRTLSRQASHP